MDFSHYSEPTEEWTSYVCAHPIIVQGGTQSDQSLSATASRAAHDNERFRASSLEGKFNTEDHKVRTRDGLTIPIRLYAPKDAPR